MRPVGVAIAGTGWGARTLLPAFQATGRARVVAICGGRNRDATRRIAAEHGIPNRDEGFAEVCGRDDVDLVAIATPNDLHYEMVLTALEAGKHVLCEKPLALRDEEVEELVRRGRERPGLHLVNHQLRFHPAVRAVRDALGAGSIGRPRRVSLSFETRRYVDPRSRLRRWWFDPDRGGGMIWAMGPHLADLALFWLGGDVVSVQAHRDRVLDRVPSDDGSPIEVRAESEFDCQLVLSGGERVLICCTAVGVRPTRLQAAVLGSGGEIGFESPDTVRLTSLDPETAGNEPLILPAGAGSGEASSIFHSAFEDFAAAIVDAVAGGGRSVPADAATFEDGLVTHRILRAIEQSSREGRTVHLAPGGRS